MVNKEIEKLKILFIVKRIAKNLKMCINWIDIKVSDFTKIKMNSIIERIMFLTRSSGFYFVPNIIYNVDWLFCERIPAIDYLSILTKINTF